MKKMFFLVILSVPTLLALAQKEDKEVFAFTITNYIVNSNDSVSVVQVSLPNSFVKINEKQLGLVKHNFTNNKIDTNSIGYGRCNLIKGNYYYFGVKLYNKNIKPVENDLIYVKVDYPATFKGQFYAMIKNAIYFTKVTDERFYDFETALVLTKSEEDALIDPLVADIRYTGKVMEEQIPEQNKRIEGGIFNGIKLFTGMKTCTAVEVKQFMDYVIARPTKYAGNTWKISETFATWMDSKTPTVIK